MLHQLLRLSQPDTGHYLATESGLRAVQFHLPATGGDKLQFFTDADVFVFTPRQREGHPWVIVEAMAAGLPVISTDRGAIAETVIDGESGWIENVPVWRREDVRPGVERAGPAVLLEATGTLVVDPGELDLVFGIGGDLERLAGSIPPNVAYVIAGRVVEDHRVAKWLRVVCSLRQIADFGNFELAVDVQ